MEFLAETFRSAISDHAIYLCFVVPTVYLAILNIEFVHLNSLSITLHNVFSKVK